MGRRLTLCKRRHADTFPLTGETGLAHFCHSVCGFLLFHLQSASSSALFPGKCLPEHSGTRGAEVTFRSASSSYRRRSAARLDGWSLQEFGGLLPIPKGDNPIELLLLCMVSAAIKGASRALARRPWSRDEVCLLLGNNNGGEKRNGPMLRNRLTVKRFIRHRRLLPGTASGRSPVHAIEHSTLRAAWKYAYLFHAPVRLTRHVE
jgi:hypothetical protein